MKDFLDALEQYKDIKDMAELIDEVQKLRYYYKNHMDEEMIRHIHNLMRKYSVETEIWNALHPYQPNTRAEYYIGAENFLCTKSMEILIKNGIKIASQQDRR